MAIDYTALTEPYDRAAGNALAQQLRMTVPTGRKFVGMGVAVDVIGAIGIGLGFIVLFPIGVVTFIQGLISGDADQYGPGIVMIIAGALCAAFTYWLIHRYFRRTGSAELWWRLDRFARANGLVFQPWSPEPAFPSAIFSAGVGAATYSHVRHEGADFYNIGNLYYQTGKVGNETFDHRWGFVAIHLTQTWPAMLLDADGNDRLGMNGLPFDLAGTELLTLTGTGADQFRLWGASKDLARATQVFTPALIEALATGAGTYDAHLVDDWLFIYSRREFDMADPTLLAELFGFIEIVRAAKA